MSAPATPDEVAAALRGMGFAPHRALALATDPQHEPQRTAKRRRAGEPDPRPRARRSAGPAPTVPPEILVGATAARLREIAREAGTSARTLYVLRNRHLKRVRAAARAGRAGC